MECEPVESLDDIIKNFLEFDKIHENHNNLAYERFKSFKHWYYLQKDKKGIFAPSKFIGYKETTLENYNPKSGDGEKGGRDGRGSEKILSKYFIDVKKETPDYDLLNKKLEIFASDIGRELRGCRDGSDGYVIHKLKDEKKVDDKNKNQNIQERTNVNKTNTKTTKAILIKGNKNLKQNKSKQQLKSEDKHEIINKAFKIILPFLAKYIGNTLQEHDKNAWWQKFVLNKLNDNTIRDLPRQGSYEKCIKSLDISACLNIIEINWKDIFVRKMDKRQRTWSHELLDIRNRESHYTTETLTENNDNDIIRALDTMERFMRPINIDVANQILKMKQNFENKIKNE